MVGGPSSGAGGVGIGAASAGAPVVLQPSEWWWQLRQGARVRGFGLVCSACIVQPAHVCKNVVHVTAASQDDPTTQL